MTALFVLAPSPKAEGTNAARSAGHLLFSLAIDRIKRAGGVFSDAGNRFHGPTRLRFKLFCRSSIILESVAWLTIAMLDGTEQQANENSFEHEHYQKAQRRKAQHCSRIEMDHGFHHAHENRNCKQAQHQSSQHHCD